MKRLVLVVCALLLLPLHLLAAPPAPPLAERLPNDALVYVGWAGAKAQQPAYDKSNLKGIVDSCTIREFFDKQVPALIEKMGAQKPEDAAQLKQVLEAVKPMWDYPTALYVGPFDWTDPQNPRPSLAVICQAGPDAPAMVQRLEKLLASQPKDEKPRAAVRQAGDVVVLSVGKLNSVAESALGLVVGDKVAHLSGHPDFQKTLAGLHAAPAVCFYADVPALLAQMEKGIAASGDEQVIKTGPAVLTALGLRSLRQVAYTGGFDGAGWSEKAFVGIAGPRTGLLTLLDPKPLTDDTLKLIPKSAFAFNVLRLDLNNVLEQIRAIAGKIDPQVGREFNAGLGIANITIGLNIQKDLLATLGDTWVLYRTPAKDETPAGITLVVDLRDAATLEKSLATLRTLVAERQPTLLIADEPVDGVPVTTIQLPNAKIAWALHAGKLIVSRAETIAPALAQLKGAGAKGSILDNPQFVAQRKALGANAPFTLDYGETARIYPDIAGQLIALSAMANMQGVEIPPSVIPSPEQTARFMTPGVSASWLDEAGFHTTSQSAFPGATLLSGQMSSSMLPVGALGTAILLPALGQARERAIRTVESSNLHQVGMGVTMYAQDKKNRFPEHLAELIASGYLTPKTLISKPSGTTVLVLVPEQTEAAKKDWHAIAKDVDAHSDIVYFGKGLTMDDAEPTLIVAYIRPSLRKEGLNVLFADGHVEWVKAADVERVWKDNNEARKGHNCPPLELPTLGPAK